MFAWQTNERGNWETIGVVIDGKPMPLVSTHRELVERARPIVEQRARPEGVKFRLVEFKDESVLEEI